MKTLFILIVISASVYLLLPEKSVANIFNSLTDNFSKHLPQTKIENAAEKLLAQVDNKLKIFEKSIDTAQKTKISALENEILALKKAQKVTINKHLEQGINVKSENKDDRLAKSSQSGSRVVVADSNVKVSPMNKIINEPKDTQRKAAIEQKALSAQKIMTAKNEKKWQLQRQASLQDIAQRMNETSLQALTF
jgi:hypothetical protein